MKQHVIILVSLMGVVFGLECPHAGVFRHPQDCTSLYSCHGNSYIGYKIKQHKCPYGTALDSKTIRCVPYDQVPSCTVLKSSLTDASDPVCANQLIHCQDCTNIVTCTFIGGEYVNPIVNYCGFTVENLPRYCDPEQLTCVDILPAGCDVPGFICTEVGVFPDPNQCEIYHTCRPTGIPDPPIEYVSTLCTDGAQPTFNTKKFQCAESNDLNCERTICTGVGLQAYPSDNRFYIFCQANNIEIYRCPGNERFNPNTLQCEFVCQNEGLFVSMRECHNFIRCQIGTSGQLEQTEESCPSPLAFNPTSQACESVTNVNCPPA